MEFSSFDVLVIAISCLSIGISVTTTFFNLSRW